MVYKIKERYLVLISAIGITLFLAFINWPLINRIVKIMGAIGIESYFLSVLYVSITSLIEIIFLTLLYIGMMYRYRKKGIIELYKGFQYSTIYMVLLILILVIFLSNNS